VAVTADDVVELRGVSRAAASRLLIDILDAPELGGGGRHTLDVVRAYWRSPHADADSLMQYAVRYGRGTVFKRLGYLAELAGVASECREDGYPSLLYVQLIGLMMRSCST